MKIIYSIAFLGACALGQGALNARPLDKNDIISKTWDEIKKKYKSRQENKELQNASSIEITQRAQKLHDDVFRKYETELNCFFRQQFATSLQTLFDETQKLFAHFEKRAQETGYSIDYIRELKDDRKKMEEFVKHLEQAKKTAKIQLESKDLEKDAKILGKRPGELRSEYQETIKQATILQKNLTQLSEGLKKFKKSPIFFLKDNGQIGGVSLDLLDGKNPQQTQEPAKKSETKAQEKPAPKQQSQPAPQVKIQPAPDKQFEKDLEKIRLIKMRFLNPSFSRVFKLPKKSRLRTHFKTVKSFFAATKELLSQGLRSLTASTAQTTDKQASQQKSLNSSQPHPAIMQQQQGSKK